jgi:TATA-box binding protein (TBP) (component of TFIID and TFIIIB)
MSENEKHSKPKIVNRVATGQFGKPLNLEELYKELDVPQKDFEPEQYPALLVKVGKNKKHVNLYRNGKYIITGITSEEELIVTFNEIQNKLEAMGAL